MSYPKWVSRGHAIGQILCLNEDEEAAVNAEREARENPPSEDDDIDAIRAKLDEAGIEYDKRWGIKRLKELLPE